MPASFEWEPKKAKRNLQKHQVAFEEAGSIKATENEEKFYQEAG